MKSIDLIKKELNAAKESKKTELKGIIHIEKSKYIFSENIEVNDFLNNKSYELINFLGNGNLFLGKIFYEVKEYLENKKEEEITYMKFLEANGFNRMTALRYRNRYNIFLNIINEKTKKLIALAPQRIIDQLNKIEIEEINKRNITTLEEIEVFLSEMVIEEKKEDVENKKYLNFFKTIDKEIENENIDKAKEEIKNLEILIKEMKNKINNKEQELVNKNNLKLC